ncbi:MAG: diguanylate cyclase domain-containing protein [Aristaeellaceae bacterium]
MLKQANRPMMFRQSRKIVITLLVMLMLIGCSLFMARKIYDMEEQACWDALAQTATQTASMLKMQIECDQELLESIANIIGGMDESHLDTVQKIIDEFQPNTMINHIALLLPGDKLMLPDEPIRGTSGILSFAEEAALGKHISDRSVDIRDESKPILRNFVPVVKQGQTVAMLYGVVDLAALPEHLDKSAYGGHIQITMLDALSGDYIIDTWHETLGNINDQGERELVSGQDTRTLCRMALEGQSGYSVFVSRSIGENLYFYSTPANINHWAVGIHVPESLVFAKVRQVNGLLMGVIGIQLVVLAGYFLWLLMGTRAELLEKQRLADTDLLTGLRNRNCYERNLEARAFPCRSHLTCIYVDVNGLHDVNNTKGHEAGDKMLQEVAKTLQKHFGASHTYRIGGDEFVAFAMDAPMEAIRDKCSAMEQHLMEQDYHISVGRCTQDVPLNMDSLIKNAEARMYEEKDRYYRQTGKVRR